MSVIGGRSIVPPILRKRGSADSCRRRPAGTVARAVALGLCAGLACATDQAFAQAAAVVRVEPPVAVAARGEVATFEIVVESERALGAFSFRLDCDPEIAELVAPLRGGATPEFSGDPFQNATGPCAVSFSNFQAQRLDGPTGAISVAFADLRVRDGAPTGGETAVVLTVEELTDTGGEAIPHSVDGAVLSVDGSATTTTVPVTTTLAPVTTTVPVTTTLAPTTTTVSVTTTLSITTTTLVPPCGDVTGDGALTIADALGILRAAVGLDSCPLDVCDVDGNGVVGAADALAVLRLVVGLPVVLGCA